MKVTQIKRSLAVSSATWASTNGGQWTIVLASAHYAASGDSITFMDPVTTTVYTVAASAVTATDFTFLSTNQSLSFPKTLEFENYGGNITSDVFTLSFGSVPNGLVTVVENGTAAGTAELQLSVDKVHWKSFATAAAITNTPDFTEYNITKPYAYGRIVFTSVTGAGGGANTIKAYKSGC
jgi:hypothetical protein